MSKASRRRAVSAWTAEERRWYLDLVARADDHFHRVGEGASALERYEAMPWETCIILAGNGETRVSDINEALWSDDRHGRWFKSRSKPLAWLHQTIGRLGRAAHLPVEKGEVASHICGCCSCIRAEHIVYQSVREDRLDRDYHHKAVGAGKIRPEHRPKTLEISSPTSVIAVGRV